jgi:ABC-2 type transport system permease protein
MRPLRDIWLFIWRDLLIARTYRTPFLLEVVEALFGTAMFFFISKFVDSPELRSALPQGSDYFAFALVGFVFFDYLSAALDTFDRSLEEARDSGTLEHLLVTQTSLPIMLAGSAVYPFVVTTLRIAIYIFWAAFLFHFPVAAANWLAVAVVLLASLLAFSGLGILSASYLLLFKRGNPGKWLLLGISSVAGGMLFPVDILPSWLQEVARFNPITYTLEAMRSALLGGNDLRSIWQPIATLLLFAAILLPLSVGVFAAVLDRTRKTGTLTHR